MRFRFETFLLAVLLIGFPVNARADEGRLVAIQHNGRVKTFDAFARETLTQVHGRPSWQKRPALDWLYEAAADPAAASAWKWIRIDYRPLAETLGLDPNRDHFSFDEILPQAGKIESLGRSAEKKRDADQTPSLLERKAEALYSVLWTVRAVKNAEVFRVVPPAQGSAKAVWRLPAEAAGEFPGEFSRLAAVRAQNPPAFAQKARAWNEKIRDMTGGRHERTLKLEALYLFARPFGLAAAAYLAGFLLLLARAAPARRLGGALALAGFGLHTLGLTLRVLVLERPPVSNMYESMVWMNWVLMLAALAFCAVRRDPAAVTVGAVASAVVMIYGDLLPIDTGLDVLVPVLRSNYWLTIHVLTIVSSYGIFGLAMALGHRHLWLHRLGKLSRAEEERSAQSIYRAIQAGVLLIGIGTVLGGVWANESWGRFWGWDPKETWALITLLGYLVVVHLHFARIVKPFWLAVSAVGGFLLVLFTWYGVNFVLGKGLHSYGQGSGGMNWILLYLAAEAVFIGWVFYGRLKFHGPRTR